MSDPLVTEGLRDLDEAISAVRKYNITMQLIDIGTIKDNLERAKRHLEQIKEDDLRDNHEVARYLRRKQLGADTNG